jgi:hypothetical protein
MKKVLIRLALGALATTATAPLQAQQVADSTFAPAIARPAFREGAGPVVLLDEAHHNFHTTTGRYLAFTNLARRDGYVVRGNQEKFSAASLAGARVLVIANALAERNGSGNWSLPTPSAFDSSEIAAVKRWVEGGGSLWLISDHMPFPGAAEKLAEAFGIIMSNGFALEESHLGSGGGLLSYTRATGLADHPIARGRNKSEGIDSVKVFTGQAFRVIAPHEPLLTIRRGDVTVLMSPVAWQFSDSTPRFSANGMLQGATLEVGKGRVAVFGEAAMFSAQRQGPNRIAMGMNDPAAAQNPQFMLNVLHWLTRIL